MKNATAISPQAMNAASRVSKPNAMRSPQTISTQPPTNISGRKRLAAFRGEPSENLSEPMTDKHQADDQTHDAIKRIRKSIERVHGRSG